MELTLRQQTKKWERNKRQDWDSGFTFKVS